MKTIVSRKKKESGNVLLVSIGITTVVGFTLAAFLTLTAGQNTAVSRSQSWNSSIPIVEAGIEEAMTHLNDNCTYNDIQHPATNWAADGWTANDIGYEKTTTLPGGSYYHVEIMTAFPRSPFNPAIISEGHVQSPYGVALGAPLPFIASIAPTGGTASTLSTNVARKVHVNAGQTGLFARGMVAKDKIDLHGNNIQTDSFDSSDPAFSTGGLYDVTKHKDNGDIATDSSLIDSLNLGNANIYGHVSTGPGGQVAIGANGSVGDSAWQASGSSGIQPGHSSDDMNVYFPDVKPPFGGGWSTPLGPLTLTNPIQQIAIGTNTSTTYPTGKTSVITNTTTVTTTDFPAPGTYLGVPVMNTADTTTTTYPATGTYVGTVVTNSVNTTTTTYPSPGTFLGTPITNTASTTTSTYPAAGTYMNSVATNVVTTNSPNYPTANFIGTVSTNTTPTNSFDYPASGTYIGSVATNIVTTNSSTFPSGSVGNITTNTSTVTSTTYPSAGTYIPPVSTNTTPATSATYPAAGSFTGAVMTNATSTTSTTYPSAGTYVGAVSTNSTPVNSANPPAAGTYVGTITTNTTSKTSGGFPGDGTYVGAVQTNTTDTTSSQYPAAGTYVGTITTNTSTTTTTSFPSSGTYVGTVTTNCGTTVQSAKAFPAAGTYCGTPWLTGNSSQNNSAWNWYPVTGYTYTAIVSYKYSKVTGYTYNGINSYTYNNINGYTYNQVTGYSFNQITGYTYQQISSYGYVSGTNYSYLAVNGYSYQTISGYTYDLITGYTYQAISSYTYSAITGWTWAKIVSYSWFDYTEVTTNAVVKYDYVLDDGNYQLSSFSGTVLIRGNATLYVTDSVNFTGQDSITINQNASLKLYVGAKDANLGGQGIWNASGNATNFYYYGLPSNQTISMSGNASFTGVIYAPQANLALNGGGKDYTDFIGASVTKTATLNGHYHFHYDEKLNKRGPAAAYVISTWNEIPLTQRY
jgi:hypothetical protein